jgi:hypothetical protein
MDVSDFIPSYPDIDNEKFSYELARKKEFYDLRLEPHEAVSKEVGQPLKHQEMMRRFFSEETDNKSTLLFHGMGTGKCIHPDSIVHTVKGKVKAEQLWDNLYTDIDKDKVGEWSYPLKTEKVWSYDPCSNRLFQTVIQKLYRQYVKEDIVKITLSNGYSIKITKAHHLYNGEKWTNNFDIGENITCVESSGIVLSCIDKIEYIEYKGWVYDFQIEKIHNYIANDIICHNTCSSSFVAEGLKNTLVNGKPRKRALILVKNHDLLRNFEEDIAKVCTKGVYDTGLTQEQIEKELLVTRSEHSTTKKEQLEHLRRVRISKSIRKTYEIWTWEVFLKYISKRSREWIKNVYSNRVIIIDEAHNFSVSKIADFDETPEERKKRLEKKEKRDEKRKEKGQKIMADTGETYRKIYNFLHLVENTRVLLLSGTPIWDQTSEIASLMNLILPKEERLEMGKDFIEKYFENNELTKEGEKILKEKFRGRVSYLRPMTSTQRDEIGVTNPWLEHIKVYPDAMHPFQYTSAQEKFKPIEDKPLTSDHAFLHNARETANIALPAYDDNLKIVPNKTGKFSDYVTKVGKSYTLTPRPVNEKNALKRKKQQKLVEELRKNLKKYSSKVASILQKIRENPNELVFIYIDNFIMGPGGGMMLALILDILLDKDGNKEFSWAKSAVDIRRPSQSVKRFAILSSLEGTIRDPPEIEKFLDSFNRPDNKYAERCQIIIGSQKIGEGITIKNVRQVHILVPHWNIPKIEQALGRVYRVGSHDALPENERKLDVYRHIAVKGALPNPNNKKNLYNIGKGFPENYGFYDDETIDVHVYRIAERKEYRNVQIQRLLKEVAWDCPLNYKRNVLDIDSSGTKPCDYQECNYECEGFFPSSKSGKVWSYDIPENKIKRDTYNLLYSQKEVNSISDQIMELFHIYFSLSLERIIILLNLENKSIPLLLFALDDIISSRRLIHNRYGFSSYLKEENDIYFLDNHVGKYRYADSSYTRYPIITEITSLKDIAEISQLSEDKAQVIEFCKNADVELFDQLNENTRIILLEYLYHLKHSEKEGKLKLNVAEKNVINSLNRKKYLERKFYTMSNGNIVHTLYDKSVAIEVTGNKKIYDKDTGKWFYLIDPVIEKKYVEEIKEILTKKIDIWKENPYDVVGFSIADDPKLRILKNEKGYTGRVCTTLQKKDILSIAFRIDLISNDYVKNVHKNKDRDEIIDLIKGNPFYQLYKNYKETLTTGRKLKNKSLESLNDDQLGRLLTLFILSNPDLCKELKKWFTENDLFYFNKPI